MTETERRQIIALVKSEVIPAIGCTEPIAVALCVAKAAEVLITDCCGAWRFNRQVGISIGGFERQYP